MTPLFKSLGEYATSLPALKQATDAIGHSDSKLRFSNVAPSFDALLAAEIFSETKREIFITVETTTDAERLYDDLVKLLGEQSVVLFSHVEHHSKISQALNKNISDIENIGGLLEALERISMATEPIVIVAQAECLAIAVPSSNEFKLETLTLRTKQEAGFELLQKWLREHRFESKNFVDGCGDYAVRGGIIDIFPFTDTVPYRIEFFGDEIESIREFDVISQRSIAHRQELVLIPNALESDDVERTATVLDYLDENVLAVTLEPERIYKSLDEQNANEAIDKLRALTCIAFSNFDISGFTHIDFATRRQPNFQANLKLIREEISKLLDAGTTVVLTAEAKELLGRLEDLLIAEQTSDEDDEEENKRGRLQFLPFSLAYGFALPTDARTVIYTEHELFGRRREKGAASRKRGSRSKGISLRELRSLKRGDLLVHEDKGIGKFMGLDTIEVQGSKQEVVRLSYRDGDKLFVNLDYISKLSRYSAAEISPESIELSKLGSSQWARTREKTKRRQKPSEFSPRRAGVDAL